MSKHQIPRFDSAVKAKAGSKTPAYSIFDAGKLDVTSGVLVVCDVYANPDRKHLADKVTAGSYPVKCYYAENLVCGGMIVVEFGNLEKIDHYAYATQGRPFSKEEEPQYFPIDAGVAGVMDQDFAGSITSEISDKMAASKKGDSWFANYSLGKGKANVVFAETGGDGSFAAYWGLDKNEKTVALILDFQMIDFEAAETGKPQELIDALEDFKKGESTVNSVVIAYELAISHGYQVVQESRDFLLNQYAKERDSRISRNLAENYGTHEPVDYVKAEQYARDFLELTEKNKKKVANIVMARIQFAKQDFEEALSYFEKAREVSDDNLMSAWSDIAHTYVMLGKVDESLDAYTKFLEFEEEDFRKDVIKELQSLFISKDIDVAELGDESLAKVITKEKIKELREDKTQVAKAKKLIDKYSG